MQAKVKPTERLASGSCSGVKQTLTKREGSVGARKVLHPAMRAGPEQAPLGDHGGGSLRRKKVRAAVLFGSTFLFRLRSESP